MEKKNVARKKILRYMLERESTTKTELASRLNLSMPTVLSNISELTELGLVSEVGETASNGGRKARRIALNPTYCYGLGVDITAHHVGMVLVDLGGNVADWQRLRFDFQPDMAYCRELSMKIQEFYRDKVTEDKILGIGVSLPGIIQEDSVLSKSHALNLENYSLKLMEQFLPFPVYFENDANGAMLAENPGQRGDAVYLSLNNTLGGAVCIDGKLFTGIQKRAGEFGHMLLHPGGKKCYCGKSGCADAYCAASVLTKGGEYSLDAFMNSLCSDKDNQQLWEEYLENLAILISNIRMVFDTDIILGGDVGGYLKDYMVELGEKVFRYNLFDMDVSYLKNCRYQREASAVGVAKYFFEKWISRM